MLVIQEEQKHQNKVMGIPYNEIKFFDMKNKIIIGMLIGTIFCLLLSFIIFWQSVGYGVFFGH